MKYFKRALLIFMLIIFTFVCSGCWGYREIDTMAIVAGVAIDRDPITKNYILTAEIININSSQSQGQNEVIGSELFTARSKTIFDCVRNMIEITGLRLFWAHCKVLIVSKEIAKEGMIPAIDWFGRDSEPRADIWLLISKGNSASEILKNKVDINNVVSYHIDDIMKNAQLTSKYPDSNLQNFANEISEEGMSTSVATITNEKINDKIGPQVEGSAIFKQDKLVGYLDGNETMEMLMIENKLKEGLITLKNINNTQTDATLEIYQNKTKLNPIYKNGKVTMMIDLYPTVTIDELSGDDDFIEEDKRALLQYGTEMKVKQNLQELINKLQKDYDCDALGFEELLKQNNPKLLKELKKSYNDIFANMQTQVNIHMKIKGSGDTSKPINESK